MTYVTVDVDLVEFDTDDLKEELRARGYYVSEINGPSGNELIRTIYEKRRLGQDFEKELDTLIYNEIGRIL